MCKQTETYNLKISYFSGVRSFSPAQNNQPVIDAIKNVNIRSRAFSVAINDFDTNMSHNKLKNVMRERINFYFKGEKNQFIPATIILLNID